MENENFFIILSHSSTISTMRQSENLIWNVWTDVSSRHADFFSDVNKLI